MRWRQDQELTAHLGLMPQAFEVDRAFLMESENVGGLRERVQLYVLQDLEIGTYEGEVVFVVGLEIPEGDFGRLVAMHRDKRVAEGVDLAKLRDRRLRA